jgi:hypothetical protein
MNSSKKGSGLIVVLFIATALAIGIYSVSSLVLGEFRLNKKAAVYNEAKQAAESLIQASLADLKDRFESQSAFPVDALAPDSNPLYISDEFVNIYNADDSNSNLIIPSVLKYTSAEQFGSQDTEIIAGQVPPGDWVYIDPREPGNEYDELAGTRVFQRNIEIISKATVDRSNVGTATVYARQYLQVRDAPLFAYAIFYNLPMEIAPGPRMDIYGNVHSNNDTWFQSGGGLNFHSRVSVAGEVYHGRHPDYGSGGVSNGAVNFTDGSDNLVNMKKDSSWPSDASSEYTGTWLQSTDSNYADLATQVWGGNLQSAAHGVLTQNPVGVTDYIEDTDSSTSAKESYNSAYQMIQPPLTESELEIPSESSADYDAALSRNEIEKQKYSYKAGLTIQVQADGSLNYVTYERDSDDNIVYDTSGNPKMITLSPSDSIASYKPFTETHSGDLISGLHDKRQSEDLDIIELDVGKLKNLLHASNDGKDQWGTDTVQQPTEWWNGIVYVDFPQESSASSRDDNVNPAIEGWGLKLVNGEVIPNPTFAQSDDIYGTSIATNQMMYVEGNYNADGDLDTGSPTDPDDHDTFGLQGHEAPAALIADAITFLSVNWDDANSTEAISNRVAQDTEISAAIMTGLVPSGETGSNSYSGGVENFPRFLENWNGKTFQVRGSIVALFESEVGTGKWGTGSVYSAPNRDWGFHESFAEGYLPPGTPNTRRYRGIDFQLLSEAEYTEHLERIKSYF